MYVAREHQDIYIERTMDETNVASERRAQSLTPSRPRPYLLFQSQPKSHSNR